jgi:hypothetical protein
LFALFLTGFRFGFGLGCISGGGAIEAEEAVIEDITVGTATH